MDITTKKGRRGRKDIDRIIVEKGRRGDFSPLQPDHYHSFYEIFYLWSGSCRFLLKDTVYQMEAGDLVFIAPGELHHSLYSAGEVCEIVMIYFKEEYLHLSDRSADSLTSISGQGLQLHSFMGSVPTVYQEYLHSLLTRMLTENSRFDQYSEHFERCYLEELLLMLMRHSVMNEKEPDLLNSRDADILLAADCSAPASARFHEIASGKVVLIACPKFEDNQEMRARLVALFTEACPASVTALRMEVPCCRGIAAVCREAAGECGIPVHELVMGRDGELCPLNG